MDITVEYSDEDKILFDEVQRLKERIHILEDEEFLLRREKQEHTMKAHTDGGTPILFFAFSMFSWFIFAIDLVVGFEFNFIHFAAALAIASCAPTCGVVFLIFAILAYRKYYYQVVQTEEGKKKAKKLNIRNYYAEEERIDNSYRDVMVELAKLKAIYKRKENEMDALVTTKTMKADKQREEEIRIRKEKEAKTRAEEEKKTEEEKKADNKEKAENGKKNVTEEAKEESKEDSKEIKIVKIEGIRTEKSGKEKNDPAEEDIKAVRTEDIKVLDSEEKVRKEEKVKEEKAKEEKTKEEKAKEDNTKKG